MTPKISRFLFTALLLSQIPINAEVSIPTESTPEIKAFSPLPKIEVFFSPEDHLDEKLIDELNNAKKRILVAMYALFHKKIAEALIAAHKRGVVVKLVVDPYSRSGYGKSSMLVQAGIVVHLFNPSALYDEKESVEAERSFDDEQTKSFAPIMHHKFAIIDDLLWTGSFNWTQQASNVNKENAVKIRDMSILLLYKKQFDELFDKAQKLNPSLREDSAKEDYE